MKKIIVAWLLFLVGFIHVLDWLLFSIPRSDYSIERLNSLYVQHLPEFIQEVYAANVSWFIFLTFVCFATAGVLFRQKKLTGYRILSVISFILAFWMLSSLM